MERVIFYPASSPIAEMVRQLRDEREGPEGPASFRCWNTPGKFEWLKTTMWCALCGSAVPQSSSPHVCYYVEIIER